MACKCGDPGIDSRYNCNLCHLKAGSFKWCVITKASETHEGNLADAVVDLMKCGRVEWYEGFNNGAVHVLNGKPGMLNFQSPVFRQGEIFPMEPDFDRELGWGRKASKWDVEYEVFNSRDYKKAILRAYQATEDMMKDKSNLDILEEKSIEKEQLTEKQQTLCKADDPFKVIYGWIKQNHITLKESRALLGEVFKNEKV